MKLLSVVATIMVALVAVTAPTLVAAEPQAPAQTPAPTAQPPQTAPPPARLPFPTGAQHAYIDLQRVANESSEGAAASQQVQALSEEKIRTIEQRSVELQGSQQKLQQNANVMSAEAQLQLQREIERLTVDVQRLTQDAEAEVAELQQTLQIDFQQKLVPAIDRVAASRGLQFIFSVGDGGLIWANPALDITSDVVEELNKAAQPTP
jgi:outer membrane protein